MRAAVMGGTVMVLGVVLSGCMSVTDFAVLDREAQASDTLPGAVVEDDSELVDAETARFVGQDGDVSLWLARPAESGGICVIAYESEDAGVTGCAAGGTWVRISGATGTYEVAPDGSPAPEGMRKLFDNVFVPAE